MSDKVRAVIEAARAYYKIPGNEAGGNLHIVLDDGNLEDSNLLFCEEQATKSNDNAGLALIALLLDLTEDERDDVYSKF